MYNTTCKVGYMSRKTTEKKMKLYFFYLVSLVNSIHTSSICNEPYIQYLKLVKFLQLKSWHLNMKTFTLQLQNFLWNNLKKDLRIEPLLEGKKEELNTF